MVGDAWRAGLTFDTSFLGGGGGSGGRGRGCEEPICHLDFATEVFVICVGSCADLKSLRRFRLSTR